MKIEYKDGILGLYSIMVYIVEHLSFWANVRDSTTFGMTIRPSKPTKMVTLWGKSRSKADQKAEKRGKMIRSA